MSKISTKGRKKPRPRATPSRAFRNIAIGLFFIALAFIIGYFLIVVVPASIENLAPDFTGLGNFTSSNYSIFNISISKFSDSII